MFEYGFWPPAAPVAVSALLAQQLQWQAASERLVIVPVQLRLLNHLSGELLNSDLISATSDNF